MITKKEGDHKKRGWSQKKWQPKKSGGHKKGGNHKQVLITKKRWQSQKSGNHKKRRYSPS